MITTIPRLVALLLWSLPVLVSTTGPNNATTTSASAVPTLLNTTSSIPLVSSSSSATGPTSTSLSLISVGFVTIPTSTPSTPASSVNSTVSIAPTVTANATATSTISPPLPTNSSSFDPDLATIIPRRLDFITQQQTGAESIPQWSSTLGPDGKWPDSEVNYTTGCDAQRANWPAGDHWIRIAAMSAAWHGGLPGAAPGFVKNDTLRAQIGLAVDWWFDRDFTVLDCLDQGGTAACPCGTPGLWNTNWFSNVILTPRLVGQTCLLLNTTLTATQLANCTHMTDRTYETFHRAEPPGWLTGANLLDIGSIGIALGLLTENSSIVTDAYSRVHGEVQIKTGFQVDGILSDGSFGQHSGLLYNGNYGKDYSNDVLELEIEAGGTRFAASNVSMAAFETLMNASQWMIYQNIVTGVLHWDFSTEGRFISFPVIDAQATGSININVSEIQELGKLWNSPVLQNVYKSLTTNTSTANVGHLVGNRMFWDNDYMVTRGKNYVSTLKMLSTRTRNAECTNLQNPIGFHLADGTAYTYIHGDEYEDISAAWDWNMIPGITTDYGATPLACDTENQAGVESFVGGVTTGKIGAAVMRYTNPLTLNFSFQKTWFYFDDDVQHVMVSVLDSKTNASVFSVLDQRKHQGPIYVNNAQVSNGNFSHPHTLFHADTGYLFDDAPSVSVSAGPRTGNWTALGTSQQPPETVDLFAAWIPHDPAQLNRSVAYTVFPGRTRQAFQKEVAAAAKTALQTLNSDTSVSAVYDGAHGTAMMAFWQTAGGEVRVPASWRCEEVRVRSDSALVAILDQRTWTVTVADPTQLLADARLSFDVRGAKPRGWGYNSTKTIDIVFPAAPSAGSSVSKSLLY